MKIESTNIYVGPSTFAHFPVIRHVLNLGELEEWPTFDARRIALICVLKMLLRSSITRIPRQPRAGFISSGQPTSLLILS